MQGNSKLCSVGPAHRRQLSLSLTGLHVETKKKCANIKHFYTYLVGNTACVYTEEGGDK